MDTQSSAVKKPLFKLGQIVTTPGAIEAFSTNNQDPMIFIKRHVTGDWGDMKEEDKKENDFSVGKELRIFSAYHLKDRTKIWVITEADRSATTFLLPEEY
jgi:hypothetical protein